jgi:hypothetical protein
MVKRIQWIIVFVAVLVALAATFFRAFGFVPEDQVSEFYRAPRDLISGLCFFWIVLEQGWRD